MGWPERTLCKKGELQSHVFVSGCCGGKTVPLVLHWMSDRRAEGCLAGITDGVEGQREIGCFPYVPLSSSSCYSEHIYCAILKMK